MDKVASEIMGEPVIVGVTVATQGEAAKMVRGAGGGIVGAVVGGAVAAAMAGKPTTAATPGNHIGPMFLTLGATKLAFFTLKQGFFKNSAGQLLVQHPRADVIAFDIEGGFPPKFTIVLADGMYYALECGQMFLKEVKKIKAALGK